MMWESTPWKSEVGRIARDLERRRSQRRWSERSLALTERNVMVGCFMVRRLIEAKKLSDQCRDARLSIRVHRRTGAVPDVMNWHQVEQRFELAAATSEQRTAAFVCNQVVHSFVFVVALHEGGGFAGFMVASDRERASRMYLVDAREIIDLFARVASDHVVAAGWARNEVGELTIVRASDVDDVLTSMPKQESQ